MELPPPLAPRGVRIRLSAASGIQRWAGRSGGGRFAIGALHRLVETMLEGKRVESLSPSLCVFVATMDGGEACTHGSDETPQLALKSKGVKVATNVISQAVRATMSSNVDEVQQGFVGGRNFFNNIWNLDAALREWSSRMATVGVRWRPALLAMDVLTAFPRPHMAQRDVGVDGRAAGACPARRRVVAPRPAARCPSSRLDRA